MKISKKHHFIPKAILKNFCFSGQSVFYCKQGNPPFSISVRNINSVFCKRHYNTYHAEDGSRNDIVERFFATELDNYIPSWIKTFEKCRTSGVLDFETEQQKFRFIQFFYNHGKRSPDFIGPISEKAISDTFSNESLLEIEARFRKLNQQELDDFRSGGYQKSVAARSRVLNFSRQSEKILATLSSMKILVASPQSEKKSFIIGSNPQVRFEDYVYQPLGTEGVELWTVLTPKLAVGFIAGQSPTDALYLPDHAVRKINLSLAKQSTSVASQSKRLLNSIVGSAWPNISPDLRGA